MGGTGADSTRRLATAVAAVTCALAALALAGGCGSLPEEKSSTASSSAPSKGSSFRATPVNVHRLPLGDGRYEESGPRRGHVYSCITNFGGGGAFAQGPWIDAGAGTWNLTEKIHVQGRVRWSSRFSQRVVGSRRKLSGNGLPRQPSGVFPVQSSDPAYQYDRNPNSISGYTLRASLPASPKRAGRASCVGGTIGVMKSGVPLYSAFDAGGRDAVATEIQDRCDAHPEITGQYHYHSLSTCLYRSSNSARSRLVGWALDGFGIYVERDARGTRLSSADLDACHGRTSTLKWNGKRRRMYHYVATLDFPYMVACYRGTPITTADGLRLGSPAGGNPGPGPPVA